MSGLVHELTGRRLLGVTAALHEYEGVVNELAPIHLWLHLDGLGAVRCQASGDNLRVSLEEPYDEYDMAEYGRTVIRRDEFEPLAAHIGEVVESADRLEYADSPLDEAGVLLHFPSGAVGIASVGDELTVATWPGPFPRLGAQPRP